MSGILTSNFIQKHIPYNAGDFSASGVMVWSVEAGDLFSFKYTIKDKLMIIWFEIQTSSITIPASNKLYIKIPLSKVIDGRHWGVVIVMDGATWINCHLTALDGATVLQITKDSGNFAAATNTLLVAGHILFWIR